MTDTPVILTAQEKYVVDEVKRLNEVMDHPKWLTLPRTYRQLVMNSWALRSGPEFDRLYLYVVVGMGLLENL